VKARVKSYARNLFYVLHLAAKSFWSSRARLALSRFRSFVEAERLPELPAVGWDDLLPRDIPRLELGRLRQRPGNAELYEISFLSAMLREYSLCPVLEIGTFDGRTTYNLALNLPEDSFVATVNLPEEDLADEWIHSEQRVYSGEAFRGTEVESRIREVIGDSSRMQPGDLPGPFRLIFVDGDHREDGVFADSCLARQVAAAEGRSLIAWHDCDFFDVRRGIERYREALEPVGPLFQVEATRLVLQFLLDGCVVSFDRWRAGNRGEPYCG